MHARGFTLMELMVVIAIIGLVTAGVLIKFRGNSRDTQLDQEGDRQKWDHRRTSEQEVRLVRHRRNSTAR